MPQTDAKQPDFHQEEYDRYCYWQHNTFQHFEHMLAYFNTFAYSLTTNKALTEETEIDNLAEALDDYNNIELQPGQAKCLNVTLWVPVDEDEEEAQNHRECYLNANLIGEECVDGQLPKTKVNTNALATYLQDNFHIDQMGHTLLANILEYARKLPYGQQSKFIEDIFGNIIDQPGELAEVLKPCT